MNKNIIFLIVAMIINFYCAGQNQIKLSAAQVKEDFKFLYQTLDKSHYDLYASISKNVYEQEFDRIINSVNDSMTILQINRLFQPFAALSGEGHCSIDLPVNSYIFYLQKGGTLFPVNLYFNKNKVFVFNNLSGNDSIIPGDEISGINGKPIQEIMKSICNYVSGENENSKNSLIEAVSFPRIFWIVNDEYKNFQVSLKKSDGTQSDITIASIPGKEFEEKMAKFKPFPFTNQNRIFQFINDIAYLCPGPFYNVPKDGNTS